jgi:hypothetical protein
MHHSQSITPPIYLFNFPTFAHHPITVLDRSNIGNARLQGLPQETLGGDPTGLLFQWVTSAFYFSYVS